MSCIHSFGPRSIGTCIRCSCSTMVHHRSRRPRLLRRGTAMKLVSVGWIGPQIVFGGSSSAADLHVSLLEPRVPASESGSRSPPTPTPPHSTILHHTPLFSSLSRPLLPQGVVIGCHRAPGDLGDKLAALGCGGALSRSSPESADGRVKVVPATPIPSRNLTLDF